MTTPILPKQGQSDATEAKERGLEAAFFINLRVFNAVNARFNHRFGYYHFDLNCGSGINEEFGCIGSPIAFARAAQNVGVTNYLGTFCDINEQALGQLMGRDEIQGDKRHLLFHGNNASLVEAIPDLIAGHRVDRPDRAMGMVLSDPNGAEVPLDALAGLSKECPALDIAINWNSRVRWLLRGHGKEIIDIDDAIGMLGKQHWLIRKPLGDWYWTVLIGRNAKIGDHKALGFHHLNSEEGQTILRKCKAREPGPPRPARPSPQLGWEF